MADTGAVNVWVTPHSLLSYSPLRILGLNIKLGQKEIRRQEINVAVTK